MRARTVVLLVALASVGLGLAVTARADEPRREARIGILMTPPEFTVGRVGYALLRRPRQHLHGEDPTVRYERRYGPRDADALRAAAGELVAADVDVIVTLGRAATVAAREATRTVPIVMLIRTDPVAEQFVESLDRPGGNVTGITTLNRPLISGRLGLLREAVPGLRRVTVLRGPGDREGDEELRQTEAEGRRLGIELVVVEARDRRALETAVRGAAESEGEAVLALPGVSMIPDGPALPDLAVEHRVPVMYSDESLVSLGARGLMSFGPNVDIADRLWSFVDRILAGAAPGELPVEVAAKFDLVVNVRTARHLGLTIPRAVLLRADHVVE